MTKIEGPPPGSRLVVHLTKTDLGVREDNRPFNFAVVSFGPLFFNELLFRMQSKEILPA